MSFILDVEFITYEIASFSAVMWYIYRINKIQKQENEERIQQEIENAVNKAIDDRIAKIVQQVILSDSFESKIKEIMKNTLNESPQMRMLDQIVIVLCTYVPELKNSKLCNP